MSKCKSNKKSDKLLNANTPGIREFKFDTRVEFTIVAGCMEEIYKVLKKIAEAKITISAYGYQKVSKEAVIMTMIVDDGAVQSEANVCAARIILEDCKVKYTEEEVLRAWLVYEGVGGYALLLNAVNEASIVKYSYVVDDGSIIIAVKSLEKAIKALNEMVK